MRSSLRKSGHARPWSASIAAARRRSRKSWPFATICVPDEHGRGLAREALERRVEAAAALGGVGVEAQHRDAREELADRLADPLGTRAEARELDRSAVRALARRALRVAAVVAAQPPAAHAARG